MSSGPYDLHLERNDANYVPLSPLSFLARTAAIYPDKVAVIDGDQRCDYDRLYSRCRRLASALERRGIGVGDTVAALAPNVPALLEAHYGVPMCGAVLNAINIRLDAESIAFILQHGEARILLVDTQFAEVARLAVRQLEQPPVVVDIGAPDEEPLGEVDYEALLDEGDPDYVWRLPDDEWQALSLNYTSGTTGNPKGVVYHHRGAYLNALGCVMAFHLSGDSVYLWTLPMFHCNGWTFPWAVTAAGGTHVCLRQVEAGVIFTAIARHGITHMCGAPIVLNMLVHADVEARQAFDQVVHVATGGAAPPSTVISHLKEMGFRVSHLYGLTETYGPATLCAWQDGWNVLDDDAQAAMMARQGVKLPTLEGVRVVDAETGQDVAADGTRIGEVLVRGNTVMMGYLKNATATDEAFADGWFHTGDLGVRHADGYVELKDRSKDIIISGGENISSLEVEEILYRHPAVLEAAVVARPDEHWGETPCAFVTLRRDADGVAAQDLIDFCRANMAHFKAPRTVIFGDLPKTSTGKVQKFALRERTQQLEST